MKKKQKNLKQYLNKGISTPVGILVVLLVAVVAGGILAWQYLEISGEKIKEETIEDEIAKIKDPPQTSKFLVSSEEKEGKTLLHFITPQGEEKKVTQIELEVRSFCGYPPDWAELSKDKICYLIDVTKKEQVRIINLKGEDYPLTFIGSEKEGYITTAVLSPTGKKVIWGLVEMEDKYKTKFFVANVDGSEQQRILIEDFSPRWIQLVKWSKDEKFVYFNLNPRGIGWGYEPDNLYKIDVKSGEITPIFTVEMEGRGLNISSDGKFLIYHRSNKDISKIFIKNLVTGEEQNFSSDIISEFTTFFSPNNKYLLFNLGKYNELFLIDLKDQKKKQLTPEIFQSPIPEFSQISKESKILDVSEYWQARGWLTEEWIVLERRVIADFKSMALDGSTEESETYLLDIDQTNLKKISSFPFLGILEGN
jgi:Tol biopolymer transport system component